MNFQNLIAYRGFTISADCHEIGLKQWQANFSILFDGLTLFNGETPQTTASRDVAEQQAIRYGKYFLDERIEQGAIGILKKYYKGYTIINSTMRVNGNDQWHALVTIEKNFFNGLVFHGCVHVPFEITFEAALTTGWKLGYDHIDSAGDATISSD